jgi:UDP:flavonoid glycosyltransferase YjiC (YdhE family)
LNITMLAVGTRGDVEPCVALGQGLEARGHAVRVVMSRSHRGLVDGAGLEGVPLSYDSRGGDPAASHSLEALRRLLNEMTDACKGSDLILHTPLGFAGLSIAERDGIPSCQAMMHPRVPVPAAGLWPKARFHLIGTALGLMCQGTINRWRREVLDLPSLSARHHARELRREPTLFAYSPALVPPARRLRPSERVTGPWSLETPSERRPPGELEAFLSDDPAPVFVAFDQIAVRMPDRERALESVRGALRRAGRRGILSGCGEPSDDVMFAPDVPYERLFGRVAAVVHHGGAGTLLAALRAGLPSVVLPSWADQGYWADRVDALGCGVALPAPDRLDRLGDGLEAVLREPRFGARARALGERIAAEDGVRRACDAIEEWAR